MVLLRFLIQPVRWTVVFERPVAARREGAKVLQKSPAPQPKFRRSLVTVQTPTVIQEARQAVHQTVHHVARALTGRMRITVSGA
jgi:hypothetical protein